jgi:NAD-dependent SIR2 family protein deacetylase
LEVAVVGLRPLGYEQKEPTAAWDGWRVWITPDVNVPDALLTAQRDDRLVIFAGAGVSVDPPSSLPLFKSLARRIGEDAGVTASEQDLDPPDRFLGDLAAKTDVHRRVADLLGNEKSQPNLLHAALLRLAVAGGRDLRLVTTNYDLHFTRAAAALQIRAQRFDAPALPIGDDFSGIVHLHGSLEQPPRRLVVTDQDFSCH